MYYISIFFFVVCFQMHLVKTVPVHKACTRMTKWFLGEKKTKLANFCTEYLLTEFVFLLLLCKRKIDGLLGYLAGNNQWSYL